MFNGMLASFTQSVERKRDWDCLLCGKSVSSWEEGAYFERGFSKKHILCSDCYKHKVNLLNFDAAPEDIEKSKSYMKGKLSGKVYEIQNIVTAWIEGTSQNYFPRLNDLVYYVEGPEAHLFVFRDRVAMLSSLLPVTSRNSGSYANMVANNFPVNNVTKAWSDAVVVFPSVSNKKAGLVQFSMGYEDYQKLYFKPRLDQEYLEASSDVTEVVNWSGDDSLVTLNNSKSEIIYSLRDSQSGIYLEKSLGFYGTLNFAYEAPSIFNIRVGNVFKFKFFYYQNQLMEEIYNFIVRQVNNEGGPNQYVATSNTVETTQANTFQNPHAETTMGAGNNSGFSLADEISKLKSLLDCGAITQEEYDEAKKRLISRV